MFRVIVGVLNRRETTAFPDPKLGGTTNKKKKKKKPGKQSRAEARPHCKQQSTHKRGWKVRGWPYHRKCGRDFFNKKKQTKYMNNKMAITTYLSIVTLNVNALNAPVKR